MEDEDFWVNLEVDDKRNRWWMKDYQAEWQAECEEINKEEIERDKMAKV